MPNSSTKTDQGFNDKPRISSQTFRKSLRTYLTFNSCRPGSCLTPVFVASSSLRLSYPPQSTPRTSRTPTMKTNFLRGDVKQNTTSPQRPRI
ncbi:22919_t:CDS:2 [Gigaspora margarita]|uniref:22919_t:CDS:1 n=1 Tax=Gigaspora margarita TaxID=4874 RepID=A0ABM8W620_GIGMA|nr:22919_t:CDS:2 [Gigaspora margarita]